MDIILVDTSVWVNFFKGVPTQSSLYLKNNLSSFIIATCPVVMQEILQGTIHKKEFDTVLGYFNSFLQLDNDAYELAVDSARLYRTLRKHGITVRKPNDCLIAQYAIKNDIALLNDDRDFKMIAKHSGLKTMDFE